MSIGRTLGLTSGGNLPSSAKSEIVRNQGVSVTNYFNKIYHDLSNFQRDAAINGTARVSTIPCKATDDKLRHIFLRPRSRRLLAKTLCSRYTTGCKCVLIEQQVFIAPKEGEGLENNANNKSPLRRELSPITATFATNFSSAGFGSERGY